MSYKYGKNNTAVEQHGAAAVKPPAASGIISIFEASISNPLLQVSFSLDDNNYETATLATTVTLA